MGNERTRKESGIAIGSSALYFVQFSVACSVKSPPYPQMKWALKAPAIAGLPGYTEEQSIRLLTEGLTRDGKRPDPPMPQFRLNRSDAEAVVAYLKSLR